jgi:hypothetical protein
MLQTTLMAYKLRNLSTVEHVEFIEDGRSGGHRGGWWGKTEDKNSLGRSSGRWVLKLSSGFM